MFIRTKNVAGGDKVYEYVALCENFREGGHVRQRVILYLGRKDLLDPTRVDAMVRALGPVAGKVLVIDTEDDARGPYATLPYGPMPILERLREDLGIGPRLGKAAQ